MFSFQEHGVHDVFVLDMLVTKREPTPDYNDEYSVDTPKCVLAWAYGQTQR